MVEGQTDSHEFLTYRHSKTDIGRHSKTDIGRHTRVLNRQADSQEC